MGVICNGIAADLLPAGMILDQFFDAKYEGCIVRNGGILEAKGSKLFDAPTKKRRKSPGFNGHFY